MSEFEQLMRQLQELAMALGNQAQAIAGNTTPAFQTPRTRGPAPPTFAGDGTESVDNFIFKLDT